MTAPQPTPQEKYVGDNATFAVEGCGGTEIGNYVFTWYFDPDGDGPAAPMALANGPHTADPTTTVAITSVGRFSTLDLTFVTQLTDGSYFVTLGDGVNLVTSGYGVLNVRDNLAIATPPQNTTVNELDTAYFTVVLVADSGVPPFSYLWEWYDGANWVALGDGTHPSGSGSTISNSGTATLAIFLSDDAHTHVPPDDGDYRVTVTDSGAPPSGPQSKTSVAGTLTVTNFMNASIQPLLVNAYTGEHIVLTCFVGNGIPPYTYEWRQDGNLLGEVTNTLDLGGADAGDIGSYQVTVDDSDVHNPPVTTAACPVDVRDLPHIVLDLVDVYVYPDLTAIWSVGVADGYTPYVYTWWLDHGFNVSAYLGLPPDMNVLALPAGMLLPYNGHTITVTITDQGSSYSPPTLLTSADSVLHIGERLAYLLQPQPYRAYSDEDPFEMSATFTGGLVLQNYEWKRQYPLESFGLNTVFLGNTVTLAVNPAGQDGSYDYFVCITDLVDTTCSNTAQVDFANHIQFTQQLHDVATVQHATGISLDVQVSGGLTPVTYQWFKDDGTKAFQPLPGENGPSLAFPDPVITDSGLYKVEVVETTDSQGHGNILSSQATLTVEKGIPVAGGLGLALLAMATALTGAVALRRRK